MKSRRGASPVIAVVVMIFIVVLAILYLPSIIRSLHVPSIDLLINLDTITIILTIFFGIFTILGYLALKERRK